MKMCLLTPIFSLVEAFSDASFGCEDGRSQSGVAVLLGGCLVAWMSMPQPFTAGKS